MDMLSWLHWFINSHPFAELSALVFLVLICSVVARFLRQPIIIAYISTGILASPYALNLIHSETTLQMFAHIGIAVLLFMVWLWLNPNVIKQSGKISVVTWLGQIAFTSIIGFAICYVLDFDMVTSAYMSVALTFSSTIVIVKTLTDKWVLDELYGRIAVGMLIVQDIFAMIFLIVASALQNAWPDIVLGSFVLLLFAKILVLGICLYLFSKYILPYIAAYFARSQEFLLVFAIGWCLTLASIFYALWFSLEIWALLAGLTLATVPYRFEIMSKVKSLRDFFVILFFVYLGSTLSFVGIQNYILPIIILSLFVLIGNPLIVMIIMWFMGYTKKNGMMVGLTVAQISEFSFILVGMWVAAGHISDPYITTVVTIVWLITMTISSYYFTFSEQIYWFLERYLSIFEKKRIKKQVVHDLHVYDVLVFGNHNAGRSIIQTLQKNKKRFLVIDFDPNVIARLERENIPCLYGDASDMENFENISFSKVKMAVSTIQNFDTNMMILKFLKQMSPNCVVILHSRFTEEAVGLYDVWADYVLVPHVIWGKHTAMLIDQYEYNIDKYIVEKYNHLALLQNSS